MINNNKWFSIILSILMVWFMIVLTSGVFLLILWENKDTKQVESFFKAQAGAYGWLELALLKSKQYSYSYSDDKENLKLLCPWWNCENKDTKISYKIISTWTWIQNKIMEPYAFAIIPLFSYEKNWILQESKDFELDVPDNSVTWNIVWFSWWISWIGGFNSIWNTQNDMWNYRRIISWNIDYEKIPIKDFLTSSTNNYLILNNVTDNTITYNINSKDYPITLDNTYIIASWENMWTKQNLQTTINTSEYLNLLKYSLYSPEQ